MRLAAALRLGFALSTLASAAGCSSGARYLYRPEENATARIGGQPAAYYEIPPRAPHGDVRVAALGVATLEPRGDDGHRLRAMHVRVVVANNDDDTPWQVDTREQSATLDGWGQSRAAFASASVGRPPLVTIVPGESATIDLYYPLPAKLQGASQLPHVEILWRVETREGAVTERTSFERVRIEPPPTNVYASAWWGAGWYDPFWPDYSFFGAPVLPPVYVERPVMPAPPPPHPPR